jgi:hypothetical protein
MYEELASPTTCRLLELEPGAADEPLVCNLRHYDIFDYPVYEAISYVWGDPTLSCLVTCNSETVRVTNSLYSALKRVRLQDQIRAIWIDGLCINQTDDAEKSQQVRAMRHIYRYASRVLVWLGPDLDGDARDAFEICRSLGQRQMDVEELQAKATTDLRMQPKDWRWMSLVKLINCPWWQRVWIIQEMCLARDLMFLWGIEEIQWSHIDLAVANLQKPDTLTRHPFTPWMFESISRLSAIKGERCVARSFMGTLHTARSFECSDNRDRIYGILGLSYGGGWLEDIQGRYVAATIVPDYTKATESVYKQFAVLALAQHLIEDIFLAVQHGEDLKTWEPADTPSWTPCWDILLRNDFPFHHLLQEVCSFANVPIQPKMAFSVLGTHKITMVAATAIDADVFAIDTLHILSATLDEIVSVSEILHDHNDNLASEPLVDFWWQHIKASEDANRHRFFLSDFCAASTHHVSPDNHERIFMTYFRRMYELTRKQRTAFAESRAAAMLEYLERSSIGIDDGTPIPVVPDLERAGGSGRMFFKRLFTTRRGHVGMAPAAARPGDYISVLFKTSCPMVLRPQDDFYRVVGGSYMAALTTSKTEGIPHPLDDLTSGALKPGTIQIR